MNLWDVRVRGDAWLPIPKGHNASVFVMGGTVRIGAKSLHEAELAVLGKEGNGVRLEADGPAHLLLLTGEPIDDPIFGYGPFVMNTEAEIRQAIMDYRSGKMGHLPA